MLGLTLVSVGQLMSHLGTYKVPWLGRFIYAQQCDANKYTHKGCTCLHQFEFTWSIKYLGQWWKLLVEDESFVYFITVKQFVSFGFKELIKSISYIWYTWMKPVSRDVARNTIYVLADESSMKVHSSAWILGALHMTQITQQTWPSQGPLGWQSTNTIWREV